MANCKSGKDWHLPASHVFNKLFRDVQRFDIPLVSFKAHESIINSIDSLNQAEQPQELVTGSRDGCVKIWDMRQPEKAVLTVKSKDNSKDIWAVAYGKYEVFCIVLIYS